jgi:methionine--tRNA ligase beta chain
MASIKDFQQLEFRVAEILEAKDHPDADRLYVLKIKVGADEKQIVAGIKNTYTRDSLVGRKVIVVNNLDSATIRGVESQGMLLAASVNHQAILLVPERDVPSGAPIR